ncbi:Nucleotide-diphospho-sugar transferases protein [Dioscorea alata]|uniref:Nucleotide-diphospho-sugar transferases protein n=1 Tax=Dioscorea alata TaxID=55571 RepID=A0ACB7V7B0_DIOAL|nr:Nucleotide-diphospho-sugar transferases protein [Dioscorea alata]
MADKKTVILTTVNSAWVSPGSVLDLFMESFKIGNGTSELLDHLVVVAMDEKGYVRCMEVHKHCFALTTEGVDFSEQKNFMSGGYLKMVWRRIEFLGTILDLGFDFINSDADIMWFRNPMQYFYPDGDIQLSCDSFKGNSENMNNVANTGFHYVKSNNKTINFYKYWYSSRANYSRYHDQDVFNFIKKGSHARELGVKIKFLNTVNFGGFCQPSKDFDQVCTMHANCCIGLSRKIHDLGLVLDDWRKYMRMSSEERQTQRMSWGAPKNCSLAPLG